MGKYTERLSFLRGLVPETFDVMLAHCIDSEESRRKIEFYDSIATAVSRAGHKCFLPYKYVGFPSDANSLGPRDTYLLINEIMIPQVALVIGYLGIDSTSVGVMIGRAMCLKKDIIYIMERGTRLETVEEVESRMIGIVKEINPKILKQPRMFFHRDRYYGLYPYEKIKEVIEFEEVEEGINKLELAIRNFFDQN